MAYHSHKHLINLSSCTGASKVPSGTVGGRVASLEREEGGGGGLAKL